MARDVKWVWHPWFRTFSVFSITFLFCLCYIMQFGEVYVQSIFHFQLLVCGIFLSWRYRTQRLSCDTTCSYFVLSLESRECSNHTFSSFLYCFFLQFSWATKRLMKTILHIRNIIKYKCRLLGLHIKPKELVDVSPFTLISEFGMDELHAVHSHCCYIAVA